MADLDDSSSGSDVADASLPSVARCGKRGRKPIQERTPILDNNQKIQRPDNKERTAWFQFRRVHKKTLYEAIHQELVVDGHHEDTLVNIRFSRAFAETIGRLVIAFPGFRDGINFFHFVQMVAVARRTGK